MNDLHILDSPLYQHHRGHPVVILWGFGFDGSQYPATPATVAAVQAFFTAQNVTLVGGVPTDWRNNTRGFDAVFRAFPVLHPWLVGRFGLVLQCAHVINRCFRNSHSSFYYLLRDNMCI